MRDDGQRTSTSAGDRMRVSAVKWVPPHWIGVSLCAALLVGCGGGSGGGSSSTPPPVITPLPTATIQSDSGRTSFTYVTLKVWANAAVWDGVNRVLLAVTNSSSPTNPSALLSIDPTTGLVGASQSLSTQPTAVAVSADGQYVYVGYGANGRIQRFAGKTLTPDISFTIGTSGTAIQDIHVSPANPHTIAVAATNLVTGANAGVVICDDAVMRPQTFVGTAAYADPYHGYLTVDASNTSWSSDGSILYVFNLTNEGLFELAVTPQGLTLSQWLAWVPSGGFGGRVAGHQAFIDGGEVVDLTGPVQLVGQFVDSGTNIVTRAELLPNGKSFSVQDHYNSVPSIDGMILWASDIATFSIVDSITFNGIASATEGRLSSWGTDGLVWADAARMIIGKGTFTASGGAATPASAPSVLETGTSAGSSGSVTYRVLDASALDVAVDPCGNFYVSTFGGSPFRPNSVVSMDFASASVKNAAYAGSGPFYLATATDCSAVYAGLDTSNSIAEIDTGSFTLSSTISLGISDEWGAVLPRSLSVSPGSPSTVAVATQAEVGCLGIDVDVRIYDGVTERSSVYAGSNRFYAIRSVTFGPNGGSIYAFDSGVNSLDQFGISQAGVQSPSVLEAIVDGDVTTQDSGRMLRFDSGRGRIFSQFGDVYDTTTTTSLGRMALKTPAGQLGTQCGTPTATVATDATSGKIFYVTYLGAALQVDTYDPTSLAWIASVTVPTSSTVPDLGVPLRTVRPTSDSLAVVTMNGYLILLDGSMLGP